MTYHQTRWPLVALCAGFALPLPAQSVLISQRRLHPDHPPRFAAMYHLESGVSMPTRAIAWTTATPSVVRIAPVRGVPGDVLVTPRAPGGAWIRASATVFGRVYSDSVYIVSVPGARASARISAVDSMAIYTVDPVTRVRMSSLAAGESLQACVQFFEAGHALVADTCAGPNAGLPYGLSYGLAMEATRAFRRGRTFIVAASPER